MTKAEIVAEIANKTGVEKIAVQSVVETMMETIKNAMTNGETFTCVVLVALLLKREPKRQEEIFRKTLLS
jgi:DNA-binding protein HU-beta